MKKRSAIVSGVTSFCVAMMTILFLSQNPASAANSAATSTAAGSNHSLILKGDGTIWAWGDNFYGQLGDGTKIQQNVPVQVKELSNITRIAAGNGYSIALKADGTVWSWGSNGFGQLGDGTYNNKSIPVQTTGLTDVIEIAAGPEHVVALKKDGTVWIWGSFPGVSSTKPIKVQDIADIKEIAAGHGFNLAVKKDGTVWAWGNNSYGQLGLNHKNNPVLPPSKISNLSNIVSVTAGMTSSYALDVDGKVYAWGSNVWGELGDGTSSEKLQPIQVPELIDIEEISSGFIARHCLARKKDGSVYVWGYNSFGQLGNGTTTSSNKPIKITLP